MTKRIVSGIFILTALGALGVILAGALTSGEQLIVRFLTAVIVAALGLYVISDLRLQAADDAAGGVRPGSHPRLAGIDAPPNSTAAFMATVTSKGESPSPVESAQPALDEPTGGEEGQRNRMPVGATSSSTSELEGSAVVEAVGPRDAVPVPSLLSAAPVTVRAADLPALMGQKPATITDLFAKRARDERPDQTWPSFGIVDGTGQSGLEGVAEEEDTEAKGGTEATETINEATETINEATDERSTTVASTVEELDVDATKTTDLPAAAATEFEYSGDLDAPVFEWPAAAGTTTTSISIDELMDHQAATPDTPAEDDAPRGDSASDDRVPVAADDIETDTSIDAIEPEPNANEGDLALPAPFLPQTGVDPVDYADAPLAPIIDLRNAAGSSGSDIDDAIRTGEVQVVAALIEQGMLSTDGPISDRDVRTMVYVAFTSNELRKLLLAGGTPDGPNAGIDLGPVELFQDGMVQPPKMLYAGPPVEVEARSQLG